MSKIEWTNKTWNPIIGCEKISEGCKNCYAEKMSARIFHMTYEKQNETHLNYSEILNDNLKWSGETVFCENMIDAPLKRKIPTIYFICSMGDLFHESIPFSQIDKIMTIISITPGHVYQILTKRPKRMLDYFKYYALQIKNAGFDSVPSQSDKIMDYYDCPPNLWIGVTAENQKRADERIPILIDIPASVRYVSCEPLLGDINLLAYLTKLNWIIAGPETGPHKREMKKDWLINLYHQCTIANVSFFDKKDILGINLKEMPYD